MAKYQNQIKYVRPCLLTKFNASKIFCGLCKLITHTQPYYVTFLPKDIEFNVSEPINKGYKLYSKNLEFCPKTKSSQCPWMVLMVDLILECLQKQEL